jgi:hypothetical protein
MNLPYITLIIHVKNIAYILNVFVALTIFYSQYKLVLICLLGLNRISMLLLKIFQWQ